MSWAWRIWIITAIQGFWIVVLLVRVRRLEDRMARQERRQRSMEDDGR